MLMPTTQPLDRYGDWILTFTGKRFFPLDPRPEDVDFRDICHALSLETRYGGHCAYHYSVAQHTVLLHDCIVANGGFRKGVARYCLIHDASEAYLKDIPRPLKASLPDYIEVERQLCNMLESMFMVKLYDFEKSDFKELDTRICRDEMQALFAPELLPNWNVKSLGLTITPWSPEQAEQALLKLFKHYWPGLL